MAHRLKRFTVVTVLVALVLAGGLSAGFMWRLSQGPVALTFLTGYVQQMMNANFSGLKAEIGDVIIERDQDTGAPRFRLRDIRLSDSGGNLIAMAPRAAVDVNGRALLTGSVEPTQFDLIGARIMARREADGTLQLGFQQPTDSGVGEVRQAGGPTGKQDRSDRKQDAAATAAPEGPEFHTVHVLQFLDRELISQPRGSSAMASLASLRVSQASISLYDEVNQVWWHAPEANLVFRRLDYGFAVFADAVIASGAEPWRTELVASYKAESGTISLSARIFDLVPADIADEVFALSRLAQVRLPLSGQAEADFTADGRIIRASAELSTGAGRVGFPGYISEPILIDEGQLRLNYDPESGAVEIGESAVVVGGHPTRISGRAEPIYSDAAKLTAIRFELGARAIKMAAAGPDVAPLALDRIQVKGVASIEEASLEIEDLLLMSGNAGLRTRGRFIGGEEAVGVYFEGLARDLSAEMVKKLWPPIVAAGARKWITENVTGGRIADAQFSVAIPSEAVAAALDRRSIPDDMVDVTFTLVDIDTRYFHDLPPVRGAYGTGRITGGTFQLELQDGVVTVPSGGQVTVRRGTMESTDLAEAVSPTVIRVEAAGAVPELLELIDLEPLRLVSDSGFDASKMNGDAVVNVAIQVPLARDIPEGSVRVTAQATVADAVIRDALEGMHIEDGELTIEMDYETIRVTGPVRLNGADADLLWTREVGPDADGDADIELEAVLSEAERQELGAAVNDFVRGPVKVTVTASEAEGRVDRAHVEADLTEAELRIDAIGWAKPSGAKAKAAFDLDLSDRDSVAVTDLAITGAGPLELAGWIKLDRNGGLAKAAFNTVRLGEGTDIEAKLESRGNDVTLAVTGRSFDARGVIGKLFSTSSAPPGEDAFSVRLEASLERLVAKRGEVINDVRGTMVLTGGVVDAADLSGRFPSGAPIALQVVETQSDLRELTLVGSDGGATLRAVDLYSRISGGRITFRAFLGPGRKGTVQRGLLEIREFEVQDETVLSDVDRHTPDSARGVGPPRRDARAFSKLTMPFSVDESYIRIGDALVQGPELGASAQGQIRKADGAMDIGGTIIPAYALNAALSEVPLVGDILTGGKGQGIFGLTYAIKGTRQDPKFLINPVSALAPGILRRLFDIGGGGVAPDGTKAKPRPSMPLHVDR